jgi:hypothetical protein
MLLAGSIATRSDIPTLARRYSSCRLLGRRSRVNLPPAAGKITGGEQREKFSVESNSILQ